MPPVTLNLPPKVANRLTQMAAEAGFEGQNALNQYLAQIVRDHYVRAHAYQAERIAAENARAERDLAQADADGID